jgi:hypothetical protein
VLVVLVANVGGGNKALVQVERHERLGQVAEVRLED